MEEKEILEKYQKEIAEINQINNEWDKTYANYHNSIEKFIEDMNKLEGRLPYLPDEEYNFRIGELFGLVKDAYKTLDVFYSEIIGNKKHLNDISFYLRVIIDNIKELEDIKSIKNEFQNKMKKYEEDIADFRTFKNIIEDIKKREKQRREYRGPEIA